MPVDDKSHPCDDAARLGRGPFPAWTRLPPPKGFEECRLRKLGQALWP